MEVKVMGATPWTWEDVKAFGIVIIIFGAIIGGGIFGIRFFRKPPDNSIPQVQRFVAPQQAAANNELQSQNKTNGP